MISTKSPYNSHSRHQMQSYGQHLSLPGSEQPPWSRFQRGALSRLRQVVLFWWTGSSPSSAATFSKVKAKSCCKEAAAVLDTTAVLLPCKEKQTWKAAVKSLPLRLSA